MDYKNHKPFSVHSIALWKHGAIFLVDDGRGSLHEPPLQEFVQYENVCEEKFKVVLARTKSQLSEKSFTDYLVHM